MTANEGSTLEAEYKKTILSQRGSRTVVRYGMHSPDRIFASYDCVIELAAGV